MDSYLVPFRVSSDAVVVRGSTHRPGPESKLVNSFISTMLSSYNDDISRVVFIEPKIGTKRPDIIIVEFDGGISESWKEDRWLLTEMDLRLLHNLFLKGMLSDKNLPEIYSSRIQKSIERLLNADLVFKEGDKISIRNIERIFAVRRIVSYEAKMSAITKAIEQAYFNTWFSSESYIITEGGFLRERTKEKANSLGIGVWLMSENSGLRNVLTSEKHEIPQSYISWMLNEFTWRIISTV